MTLHKAGPVLRRGARAGARAARTGAAAGVRKVLPSPPPIESVPEGRVVDLPGRGRTFVVDVPGPTPDAPTIVLLHALGCTAYLSWVATFGELSKHYRVVTFDQRWHGRGIRSERFRFTDCADDVVGVLDALGIDRAVVAGYSMGGAVAQLTWVRHRKRVSGLVLCSTARNYRGKSGERFFFPAMTAMMNPLARYALNKVEQVAQSLPEMPDLEVTDPHAWSIGQWRSTSAWSMPEVLGELGRFNSAMWISGVDVPTAVVVTDRDHAIPARRQLRLADAIDDARVYRVDGGHASLFLKADLWIPVFVEAVHDPGKTFLGGPPTRWLAGGHIMSPSSSTSRQLRTHPGAGGGRVAGGIPRQRQPGRLAPPGAAQPVRLDGLGQVTALVRDGFAGLPRAHRSPRRLAILGLWFLGIVGDGATTLAMLRSGEFVEGNPAAAVGMGFLGLSGYVVLASVICVLFAVVSTGRPQGPVARVAVGFLLLVAAGKFFMAVSNLMLWASLP